MHEPVIGSLEEILSGAAPDAAETHLAQCSSCREEVAALMTQSRMFNALRAPADVEPSAGFYARVLGRIESQTRPSVWSLFSESLFAKRLAYASMSFVVLLGSYFVSATQGEQITVVNAPEAILADDNQVQSVGNNPERDREAILVTLASYEE